MATKTKGLSALVTFTKPGSKKLATILSSPQTERQKQSVQKAVGTYSYYIEKWKNSN